MDAFAIGDFTDDILNLVWFWHKTVHGLYAH